MMTLFLGKCWLPTTANMIPKPPSHQLSHHPDICDRNWYFNIRHFSLPRTIISTFSNLSSKWAEKKVENTTRWLWNGFQSLHVEKEKWIYLEKLTRNETIMNSQPPGKQVVGLIGDKVFQSCGLLRTSWNLLYFLKFASNRNRTIRTIILIICVLHRSLHEAWKSGRH